MKIETKSDGLVETEDGNFSAQIGDSTDQIWTNFEGDDNPQDWDGCLMAGCYVRKPPGSGEVPEEDE